jgi:cytochrome c553
VSHPPAGPPPPQTPPGPGGRAHTPRLTGQQQIPLLAGQDLAYLLKLLRGFKAGTASDLDGTMTMAARPLTDEEVENLAHYLASLEP